MLKFGLAPFQLPAFALLYSAKASCGTWWFLLGWLFPSYFLTKLFLVCIWVLSTLSSSSLSHHTIIWGILASKHIPSPCFPGQGHPWVFPAGMLALKVTAGGGWWLGWRQTLLCLLEVCPSDALPSI